MGSSSSKSDTYATSNNIPATTTAKEVSDVPISTTKTINSTLPSSASAINQLMEELKVLQQNTLEWKKPKTGESCSHMHVENWSGIFMCSGCQTKVTDADKIQSETEAMNKLGVEDLSEPGDSVNRGVTIAFLVAFCEAFDLYEVTTGDVLRDFIVPMTSGSRCRFVELDVMQKSGVVGPATTFISHCNKALFGDLVAALCDGGADQTRRVWPDIFTVRQWPSSKSDLHFELVIEQCPSFMVVCPSIEEVRNMILDDASSRRFHASANTRVPFFRIWCLYEIFCAAHFGKPIAMKCGRCRLEGPAGQRVISFESDIARATLMHMGFAINVYNAEATVASDRAMIFDKILSFEGGVAGFNVRVRGVTVGALAASKHPALQCAACGDAAAMAAVRERAEEFFPLAAAGGFLAVVEGQAHVQHCK